MLGLSSDPIELHTFLMKDPDLLKETNKILNRGQRSYNVSFLTLSVKLFYVLFYALQVVYLRVLFQIFDQSRELIAVASSFGCGLCPKRRLTDEQNTKGTSDDPLLQTGKAPRRDLSKVGTETFLIPPTCQGNDPDTLIRQNGVHLLEKALADKGVKIVRIEAHIPAHQRGEKARHASRIAAHPSNR